MAYLLGIDTGGTYTDAVLLDDASDTIIAKAKSLTTRPDLARGIGSAIDAVLADSAIKASDVAMVSMSTTLATNALVEGKGGRVGLVFIGFNEDELNRAGLSDALGDDPVIFVDGGHVHSGAEAAPLDVPKLVAKLETFSDVTGIAIASKFATRNSEHEVATRTIVREHLSVPVTCSHELSQALGGPKRALTAVLNARLIGLIDQLITATKAHLKSRNIDARLMVVRGDGALISAERAAERPIETILSGPAASVAGAQWLTGAQDALVSDIGGTTTDICVLRDGRPQIDPKGAKVGRYRTMVEAVAMRTFGLGGDSEVSVNDGLGGGLTLGPRRVMPVSLLAEEFPDVVHNALDKLLSLETPPEDAARFVVPQWAELPDGLDAREMGIAARLGKGPLPLMEVVTSRVELPALARLVQRGLVLIAGLTPTDASLVLGRSNVWDKDAATKALTLMAKRRVGSGDRLADGPIELANAIVDQLTQQSVWALLESGFAEEGWDDPAGLARHSLVAAGLSGHRKIVQFGAAIAMPLIGLGASAKNYYPAIGTRLNCETILPENGDVANAIGAVVGQVSIHVEGTVTSGGQAAYRVHLPSGVQQFSDKDMAVDALRKHLIKDASDSARRAGVEDIRISENLVVQEAQIEARAMFVEANMRITASGRPRIAP